MPRKKACYVNEVDPIKDVKKIDLIKHILAMEENGQRNLLLFTLGINTAYLISDLTALKFTNLLEVKQNKVHAKAQIMMKETDVGKKIYIHLTKKMQRDILAFMQDQHPTWYEVGDLDHYIFISRMHNGGERAISRHQVWSIISEAATKAGLKNIGPHSMRKTFGYHLYKNGTDIKLIQDILNHSSTTITCRYIGIAQEDKGQPVHSPGL